MTKVTNIIKNLYTMADRLDQWEVSTDKADQEDLALVTRAVAKTAETIAEVLGDLCDKVNELQHRINAMPPGE